jgi:hypothetical protein
MLLLAVNGETAAFLVIGVLGLAIGGATYFMPGMFDGATRMRLRAQGLREDDQVAIERDRARRRFIAMILAIGSAAILVRALARL